MAVAPIQFGPLPQAYSNFDFSPLARLGQGGQQQQQNSQLASLARDYQAPSPSSSQIPDNPGGGNYANAIAGIESGGKYDLLGPTTGSGDRAYGKYQVMGQNIPEWTKAALGRSMTPQEFLQNPQAQDAVFAHRFGSYVQKYGPTGAAKAWFAGEGGMNNPDAADQLGTTVSEYARRFNAGLGQ